MPGMSNAVPTDVAKQPKQLKRKQPSITTAVEAAPASAAPKSKKAKPSATPVKATADAKPASPAKAVQKPAATSAKPEPSAVVVVVDPEAYRKEHDITVKAGGPGPCALWQRFEDTPFPAALKAALKAAGFTQPSPIQAQAWPLAMTGRDILATAKTGSGKTCGYLIPAISKYLETKPATAAKPAAANFRQTQNSKGCPSIVVMSPTRELAVQIHQQATTFARAAGMKSVAVYGGAPKGPQIRDIKQGAQIVIATPGRLNDLLAFQCQDGTSVLNLEQVQVLVLDEADRMCDMGFEEDIKKIVVTMPRSKQTLFFTATWPKAVARVAATILNNPIHVSIGSSSELRANKDIKQLVQVVADQRSKKDILMTLIKKEVTPGSRSIIFCNKKYICDDLETSLWEAGYNVAAIHGDRSQQDREWAIGEIRSGKMPLLVATDVAARGLDIKDLDRVINFDFPNNTEDYIHRIGRTGRAGATGTAHTFFSSADSKHAQELIKILKEAKQEVPSELQALSGGGGRGGGGGGGGKWRGGGGGGGKSYGRARW